MGNDPTDEDRELVCDEICAIYGVTREEIEQLDPTGSWAIARAQVDREREAFVEWYTAGMEEFASRHGLAFKVEPLRRDAP